MIRHTICLSTPAQAATRQLSRAKNRGEISYQFLLWHIANL